MGNADDRLAVSCIARSYHYPTSVQSIGPELSSGGESRPGCGFTIDGDRNRAMIRHASRVKPLPRPVRS